MNTIAFFDIAGTILAGNPWRSFLQHPRIDRRRIWLAYVRIAPVVLGRKLRLMTDTAFRHYWIIAMAHLLKGMSRAETRTIFEFVVREQMKDHDRHAVLARLKQHKANGDHVVLVSGLFDEMTQAFADYVGADAGIGSRLAYQEEICTGQITGPTCGGPVKLDFIRSYLQANGFDTDLSACHGYADSYSDHPLLEAVGHPTATFPDAELAALARRREWDIIGSGT